MKIEELVEKLEDEIKLGKRGIKVPALVGTLSQIGEPIKTTTQEGEKKVQEGILEDNTGQIKLNLWGDEQVNKFKVGETLSLVNGWCKKFEGMPQVATGFHGKIHRVPSMKKEE